MDKQTAIEIIRIDAKIEQTKILIALIGRRLPVLEDELKQLYEQKSNIAKRGMQSFR